MGSLFLFLFFTAWITFPPTAFNINITTNLNYFPKIKKAKKGSVVSFHRNDDDEVIIVLSVGFSTSRNTVTFTGMGD